MKPAKTTRHNASVKTPSHYENMPIQIYWKLLHTHTQKKKKKKRKEIFQIKKSDIFFIFLLKT